MRISDWSSDVCSSDLFNPESKYVREKIDRIMMTRITSIMLILFLGFVIVMIFWGGDLDTSAQGRIPQYLSVFEDLSLLGAEIGRASCSERVCQYVSL